MNVKQLARCLFWFGVFPFATLFSILFFKINAIEQVPDDFEYALETPIQQFVYNNPKKGAMALFPSNRLSPEIIEFEALFEEVDGPVRFHNRPFLPMSALTFELAYMSAFFAKKIQESTNSLEAVETVEAVMEKWEAETFVHLHLKHAYVEKLFERHEGAEDLFRLGDWYARDLKNVFQDGFNTYEHYVKHPAKIYLLDRSDDFWSKCMCFAAGFNKSPASLDTVNLFCTTDSIAAIA